jgi:hypothetical protein
MKTFTSLDIPGPIACCAAGVCCHDAVSRAAATAEIISAACRGKGMADNHLAAVADGLVDAGFALVPLELAKVHLAKQHFEEEPEEPEEPAKKEEPKK